MITDEKQIALLEQRKIHGALLKLSRNSTRENQRLDALRLAWVSETARPPVEIHWLTHQTELSSFRATYASSVPNWKTL